ncbi:MAG: transglutaminase-like domain-containing protein [Planctomycetaceae bacterium]
MNLRQLVRAVTGFVVLAPGLALSADDLPNRTSPSKRDDAELTASHDYSADRRYPVTHNVDFRVVVTPPNHCHQLRVWLPIPQSDAAQTIDQTELSTFPRQVQPAIAIEPVYGNKFAYFEFHHPQGAQIIQHRFQVRVWELNWHVDPAQVLTIRSWPPSFRPYLQPQEIWQNIEYQGVLSEISPRGSNAAADLWNVMDWVDRSLVYDHSQASLQADANHAFELRRGHCSDYHGLCATMGRALGYPTRITYGLSLFPKNSPSHCKLEAFLPPYGWVSYDVSETQKLIHRIATQDELTAEQKRDYAAAARARLQSGFRENSWLLLTRGTDYELVPAASRPVRVVRTIYAEADGVPLSEPDPANGQQREFAWMTAHRFRSDVPVRKPFEDVSTLTLTRPVGQAN